VEHLYVRMTGAAKGKLQGARKYREALFCLSRWCYRCRENVAFIWKVKNKKRLRVNVFKIILWGNER